MADLCKHDLDACTCADCNPPGWRDTALAAERGPWFQASYNGPCTGGDCGYEIEPGDTIRADGDGGYLCWVCGQTDDEEEST